jgi:hypothetical protein
VTKLLGAIAAAVSVWSAAACTTTAKVSSVPGIGIETSFARKDYVVLGTARGEACAVDSCILGACTPKADQPGEELLDGRVEVDRIRGINTGRASYGPLEALYEFFFGTPGPTGSQIAENIAMYKAIESVPNADALVSPRKTIDIEKHDVLGLSVTTKSCVKVSGKAVHIKTDAELKSSPHG